MRYQLSDDQHSFVQALRDVLAASCGPNAVRAVHEPGSPSADSGLWRKLGELGALDVLVPEESGGHSLDEVTFALLCEETGYVALPAPFVEHAGVALPALAEAGVDVLPFTRGHARVVCSIAGQGPVGWAQPADATVLQNSSGELSVLYGSSATWSPIDEAVDSSRPIWRLCSSENGSTALGPSAAAGLAFNRGAIGTAAQLVGLGRRMCDMTVEHVRNREQFGASIGSFQAVKHQLADAAISLEYARPLVHLGAWSLARGSDPLRPVRVSMAKVAASEAAMTSARVALQCHGAMGYSEEYDLQLYMKRAWALSASWGSVLWHRARVTVHLEAGGAEHE